MITGINWHRVIQNSKRPSGIGAGISAGSRPLGRITPSVVQTTVDRAHAANLPSWAKSAASHQGSSYGFGDLLHDVSHYTIDLGGVTAANDHRHNVEFHNEYARANQGNKSSFANWLLGNNGLLGAAKTAPGVPVLNSLIHGQRPSYADSATALAAIIGGKGGKDGEPFEPLRPKPNSPGGEIRAMSDLINAPPGGGMIDLKLPNGRTIKVSPHALRAANEFMQGGGKGNSNGLAEGYVGGMRSDAQYPLQTEDITDSPGSLFAITRNAGILNDRGVSHSDPLGAQFQRNANMGRSPEDVLSPGSVDDAYYRSQSIQGGLKRSQLEQINAKQTHMNDWLHNLGLPTHVPSSIETNLGVNTARMDDATQSLEAMAGINRPRTSKDRSIIPALRQYMAQGEDRQPKPAQTYMSHNDLMYYLRKLLQNVVTPYG